MLLIRNLVFLMLTWSPLLSMPASHNFCPSPHKLIGMIANTILTSDIVVCAVYLLVDTEKKITISRNCGEFLFPSLCQPDGIFCHKLGIVVGSLCFFGFNCISCLLQGTAEFEPLMLLLYSIAHLFIPPLGFRCPLVVLWQTADFGDSIQWRTHSFDWAELVESVVASAVVATAAAAVIAFSWKTD